MNTVDTTRQGSRALLSTRSQIRATYAPYGGFVVIYVIVMAAIAVGLAAFDNLPEDTSVLLQGHFAMRYFSLSMGIMLAPVLMPPLIIAGATRREASIGAVGYSLFYGLVLAVTVAVGLALEGWLFRAEGVAHGLGEDQLHMFSSPDQLPLVGLEFLIVVSGHIATGWLIGAAYLRLGGWRGTYVLPLTALPMLLVDAVTGTGWMPYVTDALFGWTWPSTGVGIGLGLVVVAVTWLISSLLVRRAPI